MGFISDLGSLISKIFSAIWGWIKDILKNFWWIILIIAIIYFAPELLAFLSSAGAPAFVTDALGYIAANVTPIVVSIVDAIGTGLYSAATEGWGWFKALSWQQELSVLLGASSLIAPAQTAKVIGDVATVAAGLVGTTVGALASGLLGSPLGTLLIVGAGAYVVYKLTRKKDSVDQRASAPEVNYGSA
jgi:hypothetical protein